MATLEQVEKLREKTNLSYEEAKNVLDSVNGDLLEALVKLKMRDALRLPPTVLTAPIKENSKTLGRRKNTIRPPMMTP